MKRQISVFRDRTDHEWGRLEDVRCAAWFQTRDHNGVLIETSENDAVLRSDGKWWIADGNENILSGPFDRLKHAMAALRIIDAAGLTS